MRPLNVMCVLGIAASMGFFLSAFTPLANLLESWAAVPPQLKPAEAIVVLGGGVQANGALSDSSLRRAVHGIRMHRMGLAPLLVFSGPARADKRVEAEVRAEMARVLGISPTAILTETEAHTTREEARRMAVLLQPHGVHTILLVTDVHHMMRSHRLFENAGFRVYPAPVNDLSQADTPENRLRLMRQVVQELLARAYYRLAGYL